MRGYTPPFLLLLGLLLSACHACLEEGPVVNVTQGQVLGRCVDQPDAQLTKYYKFEGIPYALAPVHERRFQDPKEAEPWNDIINATAPGSICIQRNLITMEIQGEENCLFINVYTASPPESWAERKKPVAVWIHGGFFVMGWGHMDFLRPDALLRQGIVVVSFNYRLGVMGFLNSEDSEVPGNAGLKDAVLALRWVQKNIAAFGGDPGKVTVFGQGSGGAMVHYLLLTQLAEGLFHGAISMSGDALPSWTFTGNPRHYALALRHMFNASCPNMAPDAILSCLQSVDAAVLVEYQDQAEPEESNELWCGWEGALMRACPVHQALRFWKSPFLPSVEAPGASETSFLLEEPEKLMREGRFLRVPYIAGFTSAEGILYLRLAKLMEDPSRWADMDDRLEETVLHEMPTRLRKQDAVRKVREFYLGDRSLRNATRDPETMRMLVQMFSDMFVSLSTVSAARLMADSGASVYVYEFTHEGPSPVLKRHLYNASEVDGVAHGEDLVYLFEYANGAGQSPRSVSPSEAAIRERFVRLFADFATTGNPTPEGSDLPTWPIYTLHEENYMEMGTEFTMRSQVLGERAAFWRQLAKCQMPGVCEDLPVVRLSEGLVRGRGIRSAAECAYYSFRGVPYAKPPVSSLRFKDAQRPEPWQGVRDALEEGSVCMQSNAQGDPFGSEDCLYANVYTPRRPMWLVDSLPVFLWIHGGGFVSGSGNSQQVGPDYIVCEDIILVAFNYRLGPFGFFYLEDAAPGNAGLKDQVLLQRWVQRNIAAFAGNPRSVTLTGESAGSASVHLQTLSPLTKGLFHRAIAMSGTAISPWAVQTAPVETSLRLAASVGCDANASYVQVVECLRDVSAPLLILAAQTQAPTEHDRGRILTFSFVPTNDLPVPGVETFLPLPAIEMVKKGLHHAVPFVTGFTSRESILDLAFQDFRREAVARRLDRSWDTCILPELRLSPNFTRSTEALNALRQFFMGGRPLGNDTLLNFMDLLTDLSFGESEYESVRYLTKAAKAPLYFYSFEIDDALNVVKIALNIRGIPGASHADDLGYLFRFARLSDVPKNSTAALARSRMLRLWTNFAKTGNPTPMDDPLLGVRWKTFTEQEHNYLAIGADLRAKTNLNAPRVAFWEEFYRTYGL